MFLGGCGNDDKLSKFINYILKNMTTQQKLQAVTEQIRKDIPRLMELSEGCKIICNGLKCEIIKVLPNKIVEDVELFAFENSGEVPNIVALWQYEDDFEIIGHEPTINDVLEWVNELPKNFRKLLIDSDGLIYKFAMNGTLEWLQDIKWDLSKPYLKDQSDKLKEFLYNLMNK